MLSRIAESLYWIGRYVERAENTARLLDVNYHAIAEAPFTPGARGLVAEQWAPLLSITGDEASFRRHYERADAQSVPEWLAVHAENPSSIRSSLSQARDNARALRDRISTEMWEALNRAYFQLLDAEDDVVEREALHDYCVTVRDTSHLFFGIADATLPRDAGYYFLRAGQYLERADNVLRLMLVRYRQYRGEAPVVRGVETHRGMALLKSVSAYEAFRKRHHTALEPRLIAEFLLLDADFPRSVRFCLRVLHEVTGELARRNPGASREPERLSGWLAAQLAYQRSAAAIIEDETPSMDKLLAEVMALSDCLSETYFARYPDAQLQRQRA
jgi:uncharacterized alpha-E superfamily protein